MVLHEVGTELTNPGTSYPGVLANPGTSYPGVLTNRP